MMIWNKGRNSFCLLDELQTTPQILHGPNQRIISACCYGNHVLGSVVPSFNLKYLKDTNTGTRTHTHTHTHTQIHMFLKDFKPLLRRELN